MSPDRRLDRLRAQHRDLDETVRREERSRAANPAQIAALKRRKLALKDEMEGITARARQPAPAPA